MADTSAAEAVRTKADIIYVLFWLIAVPLVLVLTVVISSLVEDSTWSIVTAIATFLFASGFALTSFESLRNRQRQSEYALRYPGFRGATFPVYYLLKCEGGADTVEFDNQDAIYSLAEAQDELFFLRSKRPDDIERMPLGELVTVRGWSKPLAIPLHEVVDVTVIERSDEEIASSSIDHRDFAERLGSQIAQQLTGTKIKTTIIPYAAFVVITLRKERGTGIILLAVPTTVTAAALKTMGERIQDDDYELPWLIGAAVDAAVSEVQDQAPDEIGNLTNETLGQGVQSAAEIGGAVSEALGWLDPDAATISSTSGARGRQMARLIALRINQRSGRIVVH